MVAALLALAVLSVDPGSDVPRARPKLTVRLSIGSFISSALVAPSYRASVDRLQNDAAADWLSTHGSLFDSQHIWQAAPIIGPWLVAAQGGYQAQQDMWLLVVSGALQAVGLSTLTYRLLTETPAPNDKNKPKQDGGLTLDVAPVVNNRLGLSLTLTGF
jgi:hypothetical protein